MFAMILFYRDVSRVESESLANKIFLGIQICTYNVPGCMKRNGFVDFWEVKGDLTGCGMGNCAASPRLAPTIGARTWATSQIRKIWLVGGPNQMAIMQHGTVQNIDQPVFEPREVTKPGLHLIVGSHVSGVMWLAVGHPREPVLFVKGVFSNSSVPLDGYYFFENEFDNFTFYYDGGIIGLDENNRLIDCTLVLGPKVDRSAAAVKELIAHFPWKKVEQRPTQ